MSVRRGEVPFVASRVGRSTDPKEGLGLAAELGISRAHALGLHVLWEEMILEVGDALTGRVIGYTIAHVAAKLDWQGKPAKLIAALERAGVFKCQRQTFFHPWWRETITGQYARTRAERREADAERQRRHRAGEIEREAPVTSHPGHALSHGHPRDTSVSPDINQGKESHGQPPQPPAKTRGELASQRWEWVKEHHERPMNPQGCMRILGTMSDEDWGLFQWVAALPADGGPYKLSRKKRACAMDSYQILSRSAYLQFRPERVQKLREATRPANGHALRIVPPVDDGAEAAARLAQATRFVLEALADPEASEKKKEAAKARFRAAFPEVPAPWEALQPPASAN